MANITVTITASPTQTSSIIPVGLTVDTSITIPNDVITINRSAFLRRQLQNRVNQKAHRRRKAEQKAHKTQIFDLPPAPLPSSSHPNVPPPPYVSHGQTDNIPATQETIGLLRPKRTTRQPQIPWPPLGLNPATQAASWCRPLDHFLTTNHLSPLTFDSPHSTFSIIHFEESFLPNLTPADLYRLPADDHLLSLMYYNVFRALATNARLLGLDTYAMHADDYPSPFNDPLPPTPQSIPPYLRPTALQLSIPHHPCFDIFPDPVVRDHGIMNTHLLPHGMLCMSLAGRNTWFENDRSRRNGLVIWGPPEEVDSWEITEGFVANYGWLIVGSVMLERSTNRWRAIRGEQPIFFA